MVDCESFCNFCIVHKYGVFLLNIGGIAILVIAVLIYWRNIKTWFANSQRSTKYRISQSNKTANVNGTQDRTILQTNKTPLYGPSFPVIQQIPYPPIIVQSQVPSASPTQLIQPTPVLSAPMAPSTPPPPVNQQPFLKPIGTKNALDQQQSPTVKVVAFKLPPPSDAVRPYESTGSSYFKQMMRGKHPVASISQYQLMRRKQKKKSDKAMKDERAEKVDRVEKIEKFDKGAKDGEKDTAKKHHHKHHHKSHKKDFDLI